MTDTVTTTTMASGTTARGQGQALHGDEELAVPMHEEELVVGKRAREEGRVHLRKDVVTEQQTASVPLTQERVTVEHGAVSGPADVNAANTFTEKDIDG